MATSTRTIETLFPIDGIEKENHMKNLVISLDENILEHPIIENIIAVIPAYNEEDFIGSVVLKTISHVDKVIVIDDGSNDKTADIARLAGAEVICHKSNLGKGYALRSGFKKAKEMEANVVVCLDGDGQHDPDEIPSVVNPILQENADIVIGSRFLGNGAKKTIPIHRRFGQKFLTMSTNISSNTKITDSQSGFRGFSNKTLNAFDFSQASFGIESEMIENGSSNGFKIEEIPISCKYEQHNKHTFSATKHGATVLRSILGLIKEKHPLLFFGLPGLVFLGIGIHFGLYSLNTFTEHNVLPLGSAILTLMFSIVGVLSIFSALILDTINHTVKKLNSH